MIGACVDIAFTLLGSSALVLWPLTLVNIYALDFILILPELKNPLSIASIHVDVTGLKPASCRHCIRSGSYEF